MLRGGNGSGERVRALLVAQGWQVRMTRENDVDPVSPENIARMHADGGMRIDEMSRFAKHGANGRRSLLFVSPVCREHGAHA